MRRQPTRSNLSLSREAQQLIWLTHGLADSGSRAEDRFWATQLTHMIDKLLGADKESTLTDVLEQLYNESHLHAYEALADLIEARTECGGHTNRQHEALLIAAPVLLWSRFKILTSALSPQLLMQLRSHLRTHIFAANIKFSLANVLFSPDQLPQGYCATAHFANQFATAANSNTDLVIDPTTLTDAPHYLSDVRYLLLTVMTDLNAPIFRWQSSLCSREEISSAWCELTHAPFQLCLPGCQIQILPPDAYFAASRLADQLSRPYAIRASIEFLSTTLQTHPHQLLANIALFKDQTSEEYRIGFAVADNPAIVHGVVWPLLGMEQESAETMDEIHTILREGGLLHINIHETVFPLEYCSDCHAPLYPTQDGELSHAELPEDLEKEVAQLLH